MPSDNAGRLLQRLGLNSPGKTATLHEQTDRGPWTTEEAKTMYSVKPGRGPSLMGGVGGIFVAIFGVFWVILVLYSGAPAFFALFGVMFVVFALFGAFYNFYNATQPNRMSNLDITTGEEEIDPIASALGHAAAPIEPATDSAAPRRIEGDFCPYCGASLEREFNYCPKCGKDV